MTDPSPRPKAFWDTVTDLVTAKVEPVLGRGERAREPVIAYLRDLETLARSQSSSREAVQVIASGRRLLGDPTPIGPDDGPFAHA